jgi:hypothetical protein
MSVGSYGEYSNPMPHISAQSSRRYPGSLIVRTHPINDLHIDSVHWSDIADQLLGKKISSISSADSISFEKATTVHTACHVALQALSLSSLRESGFPLEAPSSSATILNNVALPALRDTIAERLTAGATVSEELLVVGLLQFVPVSARAAFVAAYCPTSSVEESIQIATQALAATTSDRSVPEQYQKLSEISDEIVALTHHVKSHQLMAAHLCMPSDGAQIRKSGYAMNDFLNTRTNTSAHVRIVNRGKVLESLGW